VTSYFSADADPAGLLPVHFGQALARTSTMRPLVAAARRSIDAFHCREVGFDGIAIRAERAKEWYVTCSAIAGVLERLTYRWWQRLG
jgi:hypothetical protein